MAPEIELHTDGLENRVIQAVESILENETLTADLEDQSAKALLDWGVDWARDIALATAGLDDMMAGEAMSQRLRAVRRLMRAINKWVGTQQGDDAEKSFNLISRILEQAAILYDQEGAPPIDTVQLEVFRGLRYEFAGNQLEMVAAVRRAVEAQFLEEGEG
jgi:hypothetical protein